MGHVQKHGITIVHVQKNCGINMQHAKNTVACYMSYVIMVHIKRKEKRMAEKCPKY